MIRRVVSHEWIREGFSAVVVEIAPLNAPCTIYVTVCGKSSMSTPQLLGFSVSMYPDQLWELVVDAVEMRSRKETVALRVPTGYCFVKVDLVGRLVPTNVDSAFTSVEFPALKHDVTISVDGARPVTVSEEATQISHFPGTGRSPPRATPLSSREHALVCSGSRSRPRTLVSEPAAQTSPPGPPPGSPSPQRAVSTTVGSDTRPAMATAAGGFGENLLRVFMDTDNVQKAYGPSYELLGLRREVVEKQAKLQELLAAEEQEREMVAAGKVKASLWLQEKSELLARLRPNLKTPLL
jgi:hypothetical protein